MFNIHTANDNNFIIFGDIHGQYKEFVYYLTKQNNLNDVNIIICGDFGIGFHATNYYVTIFKKINKLLRKNNIHIYAFRGNHDNPEYYSNEELKNKTLNGVTNIHLVDDYDVIKNNEHTFLCIGGARSVDKCMRWEWDNKTQTQIPCGWWEGEMIKDIPIGFDDFVKTNNIKIDTICTHSSPDFCEPLSKKGLEEWAKFDDTVIEDCDNERKLLTSIYEKLKVNHDIKYWFYGHFHKSYILIDNDVLFRGLDLFDATYHRYDTYTFY